MIAYASCWNGLVCFAVVNVFIHGQLSRDIFHGVVKKAVLSLSLSIYIGSFLVDTFLEFVFLIMLEQLVL